MTDEADTFIKMVMADMMDGHQRVPAGGVSDPSPRACSSWPSTWGQAVRRSAWCRSPARWRGATTSRSAPDCFPGAVPSRTPSMVGGDRRRHPPGAVELGCVRPDRSWRCRAPDSGRARCPSATDGRPVGDCVHVDGHPRRPAHSCGPSAARSPATPRRAVALDPAYRRRTLDAGAPTRSATSSSSNTTNPTWPSRARWYLEPVDYLSMRFTGVAAASPASMTAAPGSPTTGNPSRLAYDPALVAGPESRPASSPPLVPTGSVVGEVAPAVADELGLPPGVIVVTGTPDLHSAARGLGLRPRLRDPPRHQHDVVDQLPGAHQEDRRRSAQIASVPGLFPGGYLVADNHDTRRSACSGCATTSSRPDDGLATTHRDRVRHA